MAYTSIHPIKATMSYAIDYIINPEKTDQSLLISGNLCEPETATEQFAITRDFADRKGENLGWHLIQSFAIDEIKDPAIAHKIGLELAQKTFGNNYEFVISTHVDKSHVHNHLIFNSVNAETYKHYNSNYQTYYNIRNVSDKICKDNDLSVIQNPKKSFATKDKNAKRAEVRKSKSKDPLIANDIKSAVYACNTVQEVFKNLESKGYKIKQKKDVTIQHPDADRGRRLQTLSKSLREDLSVEGIQNLINQKNQRAKHHFKPFGYKYKNIKVVLADKLRLSYSALSYEEKKENLQQTLNTLSTLKQYDISSIADLNAKLSIMNKDIRTVKTHIQIIDGKLNNLAAIYALGRKYQTVKSKLQKDPKNKAHVKVMKAVIENLEEYGIKNLSEALGSKEDIKELKSGRISLANDLQKLLSEKRDIDNIKDSLSVLDKNKDVNKTQQKFRNIQENHEL